MITARFNGIGCVDSASFSLRAGVSPSTGSISMPLEWTPNSDFGYLELQGEQGWVSIGPMYIVDPVITEGENGQYVQATIADRRVNWKNGFVVGVYNQVINGIPDEEKTLTELFDICFAAYGESPVYHNVPGVYPAVIWEYVNPATAIAELCEKYGLEVTLGLDSAVHVAPKNEFRILPSGWITQAERTIKNNPIPTTIRVVGNRIINEKTYQLKAVGLETDGKLKWINDLTYKPTGGWGASAVNHFEDVTDEDERDLARKCIYRWYMWDPDDVTTGGTRKAHLPWMTELARTATEDGEKKRMKPYIWVKEAQTDSITWTNKTVAEAPADGYSIDYERGLVKFDRLMVKVSSSPSQTPTFTDADVYFYGSHEMNTDDGDDFYYYDYALGGVGGIFIHQDRALTLFEDEGTPDATELADLNTFAAEIVSKIAATYEYIDPETLVYPFVVPIEPWGQIKSVTWQISEAGAFTTVSTGREEVRPFLPSYEERLSAKKTSYLAWPGGSALDSRRLALEQRQRSVGKQ